MRPSLTMRRCRESGCLEQSEGVRENLGSRVRGGATGREVRPPLLEPGSKWPRTPLPGPTFRCSHVHYSSAVNVKTALEAGRSLTTMWHPFACPTIGPKASFGPLTKLGLIASFVRGSGRLADGPPGIGEHAIGPQSETDGLTIPRTCVLIALVRRHGLRCGALIAVLRDPIRRVDFVDGRRYLHHEPGCCVLWALPGPKSTQSASRFLVRMVCSNAIVSLDGALLDDVR